MTLRLQVEEEIIEEVEELELMLFDDGETRIYYKTPHKRSYISLWPHISISIKEERENDKKAE